MSLSVLPLEPFEYLNDYYLDYPRNQIPGPFRDRPIQSLVDYVGSPCDLLTFWGVFSSSSDGYTVKYKRIPVNGLLTCQEVTYCIMEPRSSVFRAVTALGSSELVAANACSAKLLTLYSKIPEVARKMLIKFLNGLPPGNKLLVKPTNIAQLEFIWGSSDMPRSTVPSGRNQQLSRVIERAIQGKPCAERSLSCNSFNLRPPTQQEASKANKANKSSEANKANKSKASNSSNTPPGPSTSSSFVVTKAELHGINLQPLREKFKLKNQLKRVQMLEYAVVLNLACLYKDVRVAEFRLETSVIPDEFMNMRPVPEFEQNVESKLALISDRNNCVPSVAVRQMGFFQPEVEILAKRTDASPKSKIVIPLLVHLMKIPPYKKKFIFLASTEELAFEAAATKYLQFHLQNTEVPTLFLWNYIKKKLRNESLILFRPRYLKEPDQSQSQQGSKKKERCNKKMSPNLKVQNKALERALDSIKLQVMKAQRVNQLISIESVINGAYSDVPIESENIAVLEALDVLKKHPFVNSIDFRCETDKTENIEVELIVNCIYAITETNFPNFQDGLSCAAKKAKVLMETIGQRGCEDVIPYEQRYDARLLVALLELKTGLSIENVAIRFKFEVETNSWKADLTIDDVYCTTEGLYETQKEALGVLLFTYLIEKQSCLLLNL